MDKLEDLNTFINASPTNLDQFEQFLIQEGLKHHLEFVWAVQGLKSESLHLGQIIRTIHKHYFDTIHISESVKLNVKSKITSRDYTLDIFDKACEEVWDFLESVVYKEFLNHEYLENNRLIIMTSRSWQNDSGDRISLPGGFTVTSNQSDPVPLDRGAIPGPSIPQPLIQYQPSSSSSSVPKIIPSTSLEPLIEGQELQNQCSSSTAVVGLTREALKATQKIRSGTDLMPMSMCKQKPKFPYHYSNYNSYNPVSRQDSEVQSFSSGCLTDSDSIIETRNKRRNKKEELNCDNLPSFQPHMRCFKNKGKGQMDPGTFTTDLIRKLQEVKRQRDIDEKLNKKLNEECVTPKDLAQAIRDKLSLDEVQPDDILDKHVSRVWSDVTPDSSRSPPGKREYKRNKAAVNPALLRSRMHTKDPDIQLPKSRTFPSTSKYDQDSGISITTTSTNATDDFIASWLNNSKPNAKLNAAKIKRKEIREISSVVYYQDNKVPFCFKIPVDKTVNLSLFKEYLPKKGSYRYFFKCSGQDGVVMEEITKDDAIIPVFDGKIVAHLKDL